MGGLVHLSDSIRFLKSSGVSALHEGVVIDQLMGLMLEVASSNNTNTSAIVITSIVQIWDWWYILLGFIIRFCKLIFLVLFCKSFASVLGSLTTLLLITQTKYSTNVGSLLFFITAAALTIGGCAIWSMHFISLLGLQLLLNNEFLIDKLSVDTNLTVSSVVVAIVACWLGFFTTSLRPMYHLTIDKIIELINKKKQAKIIDSTSTARSMRLTTYSDLTPRKYLTKIVFDSSKGVQSYLKVLDRTESSISSTDAEAKRKRREEKRKQLELKIRNKFLYYLKLFILGDRKSPSIFQILIGGFLLALGVNAMHYMGMLSMTRQTSLITMTFNGGVVFASIVIALVAASAALWISYFVNNEAFQIAASFIMAIAVNGMHYTGQFAATYSVPTGTSVFALTNQVLANLQFGINLQTLLLLISSITCIICFAMIVIIYSISIRARKRLDKSFATLAKEQDKGEKLLLNVLPRQIADRVKAGENNIVEKLDSVTILFADVVEFTKMSSTTSPVIIVQILHEIFCMMDRLALFHEIEKIKTIGDCFMAASGVPEEREDHAVSMVQFAADMLRVMEIFNRRNRLNVRIRIGINSGPVVAGIIGQTKFVYDIYGDSCNVAARCEANGIPNRIVVSQSTYDLVRDKYEFEARDPINMKGKGMMTTYLLKEQYSALQLNQSEWDSFIEPYSKLKYSIGNKIQKSENQESIENQELQDIPVLNQETEDSTPAISSNETKEGLTEVGRVHFSP